MKAVAITGIGVTTSAGTNRQDFFNALERPCQPSFNKTSLDHLDIDVLVGEADEEAFTKPVDPNFDSPTNRLCLTAGKECLDDYHNRGAEKGLDGLILGTSTAAQYCCEEFMFSALAGNTPKAVNHRAIVAFGSTLRLLSSELNVRGRVLSISTACTSSGNAIAIGASLIQRGICKRVMVGGGDALCATTLSSFHILGLTGPNLCKPFGPNRPGMTLGDGAAFLVLEPLETVIEENRYYYTELLGYAMGSDAYSMTSPREKGEGAVEVMKLALEMANLTVQDIDFINAHGTGTLYNDRSEAIAINSLFGETTPVASLKGLVGHTLGGAGAVESVASIYSILNKKAWPNFNSYETDKDCSIRLVTENSLQLSNHPIILSNSFAFGGSNCCLIFGDAKGRKT